MDITLKTEDIKLEFNENDLVFKDDTDSQIDNANFHCFVKDEDIDGKLESASDSEYEYTTSNIEKAVPQTTLNLLPQKSRKKYEVTYKQFMDWCTTERKTCLSEKVLLAYFGKLSNTKKSSTMWSRYSILRTTINFHNNINIGEYCKLRAFLKRKSDGYCPKKSSVFSAEDLKKFLKEAPDDKYLLTKVVMITGITGACRRHELSNMKMENLQYFNTSALITIPDKKSKTKRQFSITGEFFKIFKKYTNIRPPHCSWFFLNYHNGKCSLQKIGINKMGGMPKQIATFLKLPNPEFYTGHSFHRTSTTILIDAEEDIASPKCHGTLRSTLIAEYIEQSSENRMNTANKILDSICPSSQFISSTSSISVDESNESIQICKDNINTTINGTNNSAPITLNFSDSIPSNIVFNNCSNVTLNFIRNKN